ncbi:MAG TPA: biotin/lipoyl-containing protein, partial [Aquabacterium sp.]|nr:biotin/lipoyl-containing protein [Aquabacterium sp.]
MARIELTVPDIGDVHDAAVIEILVQPGASIKAEQSLITIESDKASMEVPSSHAGILTEMRLKLGDKVSQGTVIGVLETAADVPSTPPVAQPVSAPAPSVAPAVAATPVPAAVLSAQQAEVATTTRVIPTASLGPVEPPAPGHVPHASPSVRKFARELGVPLDKVQGTGPKGRITQEDIQSYVKSALSRPEQGVGSAPA